MEWISVKDRLPKMGIWVLIFKSEGYSDIAQYCGDRWNLISSVFEKIDNNEVTHWMPLPEPPTR